MIIDDRGVSIDQPANTTSSPMTGHYHNVPTPYTCAYVRAYLEEIVRAYEHFFFRYSASDLLVINTSEIDFVDDLIGSAFRVNNPQATASCGCGTSFAL